MRKDLPKKLLGELLRNSKRSDRELAKILRVSQPTITRARNKLEQTKMIEEYTIIPNFSELGFEILAFTYAKMRPEFFSQETLEEARRDAQKFPDAICVTEGEGLGMNLLIVSFNKSFTEYSKRVSRMRRHWKDFILSIESFIVPIGEREIKRFSLAHLKDAVYQAEAE